MRETLPRFLSSGPFAAGETAALSPEEARHVRVRRLPDGTPVEVLDGRGLVGLGRLCAGGEAVLVASVEAGAGEPAVRWTVALAASEPSRVEWAVEKGTECGAAGFLLFVAGRSQAPCVRALEGKLPRLARVAVEAVKQCGRSVVPGVEGPVSFAELLGRRPALVAVPGAPRWTAGTELPEGSGGLIVVGPEGGLTPGERDALVASGAIPFGLGPRVLRLETAVVASLLAVSIG